MQHTDENYLMFHVSKFMFCVFCVNFFPVNLGIINSAFSSTKLYIQSQLRHKTLALKLWGVPVRVAVQTYRFAQRDQKIWDS